MILELGNVSRSRRKVELGNHCVLEKQALLTISRANSLAVLENYFFRAKRDSQFSNFLVNQLKDRARSNLRVQHYVH